MSRRTPARIRIGKVATASAPDLIAKGFRVAKGEPITFRLINPTPETAAVRAGETTWTEGEVVTLDALHEEGGAAAFDFAVALTGNTTTFLKTPVKPLIVEIRSGTKRYRESIMPALRPQQMRYHVYLTEPSTGQIICPRHGMVQATSSGGCPYTPPHVPARILIA